HRRGRKLGVPRLRLPVLLALRRASRARLLPAFGRRAGSPDGRGRGGRALETAAGRPLVARPRPPRPRPLRSRMWRRGTESLEHPPRAPGPRLVGGLTRPRLARV